MDKQLFKINILFAIADFLICGLGLCLFAWAAFFFGKWWISLFGVIPLMLYSNHGILITADIEDAQKGDEQDSRSA